MTSDDFVFIASLLWPQLPVFIIWIVGIVVAALNLEKQKRTAKFALSAFILFLVTHLAQLLITMFGQLAMIRGTLEAQQLGGLFAVSTLIGLPFTVIAWGLLLWALFSRPRQQE